MLLLKFHNKHSKTFAGSSISSNLLDFRSRCAVKRESVCVCAYE